VVSDDPATRVVPAHASAPPAGLGPHALQVLTAEHWSLLASRSMGYTEAMSRASIYVAALSGSVVALALVAQATDFGDGFVAFALVLLPVVYFLGATTVIRLAQVNFEDARWVQGMNRIRHAYLELAPELAPYFVTSSHDDEVGLRRSAVTRASRMPVLQQFVSTPGIVATVDSVVAGAAAGIAGLGLGAGTAGSLALGAAGFLLSMAAFVSWARRIVSAWADQLDPVFPTPAAEEGPLGG
jgi:hypothetical protein